MGRGEGLVAICFFQVKIHLNKISKYVLFQVWFFAFLWLEERIFTD
jgi:hypothetical protein